MRKGWESNALDSQRHGVASAQAQRGNASLLAQPLQRVQQRSQNARSAGADGVTDGHRAALHVDLRRIEPQVAIHGQRLHAEGLVQLK